MLRRLVPTDIYFHGSKWSIDILPIFTVSRNPVQLDMGWLFWNLYVSWDDSPAEYYDDVEDLIEDLKAD